MSYFIKDVLVSLDSLGILDVILPLIFVFAIVYGILDKTNVLGDLERKKAINAIIGLVIGFLFIFSEARVVALNEILQKIALLLVGAVLIQIIAGAFGEGVLFLKSRLFTALLFVALAVVFGVTFDWFVADDFYTIASFLLNPALITFLIFLIVVWFIVRNEGVVRSSEDKGNSDEKSKPEKTRPETKSGEENGRNTSSNKIGSEETHQITGDELKKGDREIVGGSV